MLLRKQHLNKQIEEFGHTSLQKWTDHEIKSSLSLLAEEEWSAAAISDGFIGVSATASVVFVFFFYLDTIIIKITIIAVKIWFPVFTPEWHVDTLVLVSLQPVEIETKLCEYEMRKNVRKL